MNLRELDLKDAPLMLEWMHDDSVAHFMGADFSKKTLKDCENFILSSKNDKKNVHRAIVGDDDTYMGTVSLKNINSEKKEAEFAITIRKQAMGKGYSKFGMDKIIQIGFEELGLEIIYWYVNKNNTRAIQFYDKNGYKQTFENGGFPKHTDGMQSNEQSLYSIERRKTKYGQSFSPFDGESLVV